MAAAKGDDDKQPPKVLTSPSSSWEGWQERILIPTAVAGIAGAGVGSVSKQAKVHGVSNMAASYAANLAIVTGCYCAAREAVRITRRSDPDDLLDSAIAGFGSGALLGRIQGGQRGAIRYSFLFAAVGTAVDFAALKFRPVLQDLKENGSNWLKMPEWSPIKVLDEEALAAKKARKKSSVPREVLLVPKNLLPFVVAFINLILCCVRKG